MWYLLLLIAPCLSLHMQEPVAPAHDRLIQPREYWLQVRLNHFMAYDTRTFPMRFLYNPNLVNRTNANIVVFVGGEWPITEGWAESGLAYDMAQQLGAGLFYTEHRFYGKSRPFENTTLSNLSYLSIDQALGDLVQFIHYIKSDFEDGLYKNAKVVLAGCSYAGTLATWTRRLYPHVVDAAFSDSGPLRAQEDFSEYLVAVTEVIREEGGETCVENIETAMTLLVDLLATPDGPAQVSELFRTCTPIQAGVALDVATFFWFGITEPFANLVQNAVPGNITDACAIINNPTTTPLVVRLADFIRTIPLKGDCLETRFTQVVANHRNTSYDAQETSKRLWTYQSCVEFGWYQSTSSRNQSFLHTVPVEYFHQICREFFSIDFDEARLRSGIERTNTFFGSLTRLPDHVVSVAGGHDPWAPLGPNATHAHHNSPVYVVPGVSHCQALSGRRHTSPIEELEKVKQAVLDYMIDYILGPVERDPVPQSATSVAASVVLLVTALIAVL